MLPERYINPFTDFGFKKLFGEEPNKDLLIDFLNQLLPAHHQISQLTYGKNEFFGPSSMDRKAIFDLYCVSQTGERFIVELQRASGPTLRQNYFKDRSVFYTSFPIQEQAQRGDWNYQLSAIYLVGILDFVFQDDTASPEVVHRVQLKDQHCRVFYDKLTYIYLEMPHFTKTESELKTQFDKWLYVFRQLPNLQNRPAPLQKRVFQKLFDIAEIARFSPEQRVAYEESIKSYRDLKNVIDTARDNGFGEGFGKGESSGELNAKTDTILNGLSAGISLETPALLTNLTVEQVRELGQQKTDQ